MKHIARTTLAALAALALSACLPTETEPLKAQPGGGEPRVNRQDNGAYTVRYNNGCIVTYNKDGRRSGSQGCHARQVARADKAIQQGA